MNGGDYKFDVACQCHDSGQFSRAIELVVELLSEHPNDADYHSLLASCLLAQKRLKAAEYENGIALSLDPGMPFAHLTQARIFLLQGENEKALEACDEALRLQPDLLDAYLRKAGVYTVMGKREETRIALDQAAMLAPDSEAVHVAYGDYYNSMGKHQEAYQHALAALQKNASSGDANLLMGSTQLALGDTDQADYHAKFAIMQNPQNEEALRLFANIRLRRNRFIGLWWRFNSWVGTLGNMGMVSILIGAYLTFNLSAEIAYDLGYPALSSMLTYGWLILVIYSWVGIPMYHKAMKAELENFKFNSDY